MLNDNVVKYFLLTLSSQVTHTICVANLLHGWSVKLQLPILIFCHTSVTVDPQQVTQ